MSDFSRRDFIVAAVATGVAATIVRHAGAQPTSAPAPVPVGPDEAGWLEGKPVLHNGVTFGVPHARGKLRANESLQLLDETGNAVLSTSWPIAYWPDGSAKWTAHALPPSESIPAKFRVTPGEAKIARKPLRVTEADGAFEIDTGVAVVRVLTKGDTLIDFVRLGDRTVLKNGRLVAIAQDKPDLDPAGGSVKRTAFASRIDAVSIEQHDRVRAVIKIEGMHEQQGGPGRAWLPFVVRLYFYVGSDVVRMIHTFIFDGDEKTDFLAGLGVRFDVPMSDEPHDRHVRFVGEGEGLFGEAVRGLTGLRRDPGEQARRQQVAGEKITAEIAGSVKDRLQYVPMWGDYTLTQLNADGFQIKKRTKAGHAWIPAATGNRSAGVAYVGGASGGVVFGQRYFWERHPVQLDIRNAHTDNATVTMWIYSPDAPAMDLRFYHDGMGQDDSYQKQIEALNITYEDYEPGYGTPNGVARTNEFYIKAVPATPARQAIVDFARTVRTPPQLVCSPQRYLDAKVFSGVWTLPDSSTPMKKAIEDELAFTLDAYLREVDQRSWYGFWDHGDVMHSYDSDRHVWRYDVGGYAWDNSELSPDLWLWFSFLRTGRADVYRMVEAMTRHTGEVDTYHSGIFKYLGTRHGVQHWADSSKQIRVSTAAYRRHFYFLTGGDERTGDLLKEQLLAAETQKKVEVGRKLGANAPVKPLPTLEDPPKGGETGVGGMGFGHLMAAWLTEAERTGDKAWHDRIVRAMTTLSAVPHAFWNWHWVINLDTGEVRSTGEPRYGLSHLQAVFGLPETCAELVLTYGDQAPQFAETWADYGRLYNAPAEEQQAALGTSFRKPNLRDHHSRCTAFAARLANDAELGKRAWKEFGFDPSRVSSAKSIKGPDVLNPIEEVPLGTNGAAQWGLAAIENLALVGEWLE